MHTYDAFYMTETIDKRNILYMEMTKKERKEKKKEKKKKGCLSFSCEMTVSVGFSPLKMQ